MGHLLNSGQVGNIGTNSMKLIREDVINKWDKLGFLDGLNGYSKDNVAQLFENQASYLINEQTTATDSGSFETVVFPIVRRVFSKLLANDIVSVQALNLPIGKLFYFVPEVSSNRPGFNAANGGFNASTPSGVDLYDQFYENDASPARGLFDASRGRRTTAIVTVTPGALTTVATVAAPAIGTFSAATTNLPLWVPANRYITGMISTSFLSSTGTLVGPDGQLADTEAFLAGLTVYLSGSTVQSRVTPTSVSCNTSADTFSTVAMRSENGGQDYVAATAAASLDQPRYSGGTPLKYRSITQKYGQALVSGGTVGLANAGRGNMLIEIDFGCPACPTCTTIEGRGYGNPDNTTANVANTIAGNGIPTTTQLGLVAEILSYANMELEDNMTEVTFRLDSVTVAVTERKLRATWSPELAQDVSAFHNIDAEAELTALLSEQVAAEIDREILKDLRNGAAWTLRWDYNGWRRSNNGQGYNAYTQKDWNQTMITTINQLSAQIHKSTLRGGANWIVCSAEVSAIFDDLEYFHVSNASPEQDSYNMGIEKIGSLSGRYTVYRDPYFPAGKILIGHKGKSLLDTGYVYAPYVPLQLTPTMYNPFNFAPIKGIMTRYAKKMVNNRFYGTITVDGVQTFGINELR
jgi:hypothetical protein